MFLLSPGKKRSAAAKKLASPPPPVHTPPPVTPSPSPLFYLKDSLSGRLFLVDTGATASVLPHHSATPPSDLRLTAANGRGIPSWGSRTLLLKFNSKRFEWPFLLAAVDRPILGADFLRHHGLVVDLQGRQLLNAADMSVIRGSTARSSHQSSLYTALLAVPNPFHPLLAQFPELVGSDFANLNPKHCVEHHVETSGPPVFAKPRRLDAQKLAVAKAKFLKMEKAGIIRRSTSALGFSPPHGSQAGWQLAPLRRLPPIKHRHYT